MKKFLLLFVAVLLPVFVFGQVDLVRWGTSGSFGTSFVDSNVTATPVTFNNVNASGDNWAWTRATGWPTSPNVDLTKYMQVVVTAVSSTNMISDLKLKYQYNGLCGSYQIKYSKDINFQTGVGTFEQPVATEGSNSAYLELNLSNVTLINNEKLYIRFYAYKRTNSWDAPWGFVKGANGGNALTVRGIVSLATVPPTALADNVTVKQSLASHQVSTPIDILQNDTNKNNLTAIKIASGDFPVNGQVLINGVTNVTYKPNNGYIGSDSFKYTLTNAHGESNKVTVSITVSPGLIPLGVTDNAIVKELKYTDIDVLSNDTPRDAPITSVQIVNNPTKGTVMVNPDKTIRYTHSALGNIGADSFTYKVTNAYGDSAPVTVNMTIQAGIKPTAVADNVTTMQNQQITINVLGNDTEGDASITSVAIANAASHGVATINPNRTIKYVPTNGYSGTDTFRYTASNIYGASVSVIVTITVTAGQGPVAVADTRVVQGNQPTDINVMANDNLGNSPITTIEVTTAPTNGATSINPDKTIKYTPNTNYLGADSFRYRITNLYGTSSIVIVNLTVQSPTPGTSALCGTYYVGTGGTFTTLTAAVSHLNSYGVNCPVTFVLTNALYENVDANANGEVFPLEINGATINTTTTNTVTFKPAANFDVTVKVNNVTVSNNLIHPKSLFKLNGADNIIFEGHNGNSSLTLINNDPNNSGGNHRTVIWLTNNTDNVVIRNLDITQGHENAISTFSAGIYSGSNSTIGGVANNTNTNLKIEGNNFSSRVIQGIYINNSDVSSNGIVINDNTFGKVFNLGMEARTNNPIYLKEVTNFKVYENEIKGVNSTFTADHYRGIYVLGNNGTVYNNTIYDIKRAASDQSISGIWLNSNVGTNPVNITVSNNFITDVQAPGSSSWSQGAYGIVVENGTGFKIYHNTVNLKQQTQTTGLSSAFFVVSAIDLDVRNNIFNNNLSYTGPGKAAIAIVNYANNTFTHLDYNNYFSQGIVGIKGNISWVSADNPNYISTLSAWKTLPAGVGKDVHSTNVQPVFVNENSDLHLVAGAIANVQHLGGVAVSQTGITHDIDGDVRFLTRPTMGADEIAETHCGSVVTWNGTSWSPAQPAGWKGDVNVKIVIAGPYPMGSASLLKSCQLEIATGAVLTIGDGSTYIVEDKLTLQNGSTMIVENNGSFVQVNEPDLNDVHPGAVFQVHRKSQTMYRYDFTYWSSPVEGFRLKDVSPMTFFDKFYSWNSTTQAWTTLPQPANSTTTMQTGIGYIVRAPQSYSTDPAIRDTWESIFKGKPNNGAKQVTIANGVDNKWNLIGNPYPSAIDVDAFMTVNENVVEGAIYLWTHNSSIVPVSNGSNIYTYSASDYVTVNAAGLVAAGPETNPLGLNNGDDFKIASGQSFFIKGKVSNANGNQVVFNNGMRVKQEGQNDQFFRPAPTTPNQDWETTGKHRVWLNMTGANNAFNQLMVGYIEDATNGLDSRFDADVFSGGAVSMYSLLEDKKLTIQGRALPFNNQDEVPLGYKTTLTGTLKIAIDHFDGLFEGQNVYLEDKVFNIVHNLKESDYMFTTAPGTFNDRFVLRYAPAADLGVDHPTVDANSIVVFRNDNKINIKSHDQSIEQVTVYDLLGKVIFDKNKINATSFSTTQLNASNQVVIVKIITDTKAEVVKKVIMN